ncbi:MAG: MATE family efflux transporter [Anaerolineae bacterium]
MTPALHGRDLTSGSLHGDIWHLAVPMMLEIGTVNVIQVLDTYWVGQLGSEALAAVTIGVSIRWVITSLASGLGVGGLAVVARRFGEGDKAAADHAAWQTILLALAVSCLLASLGLVLARPLLLLLGAEAEVLPLGLSYLRISFVGQFTLILVWVINALLRGAGEARLAMIVRILATAVNVALEPILVFGWGPLPPLGCSGSAWAMVLGFGAGLLLQIAILLLGQARVGINLRSLGPDFPLIGQVFNIALPSTLQMTLRASSRLAILGLVGLYGTFATAGYGVASRLLLIALVPTFGLGNAGGTLIGQNLGAHRPSRAERSAWWVTGYSASYLTAAAVLLVAFARPLVSLFDATPHVVRIGAQCLRVVALSLIPSGIGVALARAFDGAGNTRPAMAINLITLWGMEVPIAYSLSRWLGLGVNGVWWGRAVANLANGLLFALWFHRGRWKSQEV